MKTNLGICFLLLKSKIPHVVSIGGTTTTSGSAEAFVDIIIDSELHFENHPSSTRNVNPFCKLLN